MREDIASIIRTFGGDLGDKVKLLEEAPGITWHPAASRVFIDIAELAEGAKLAGDAKTRLDEVTIYDSRESTAFDFAVNSRNTSHWLLMSPTVFKIIPPDVEKYSDRFYRLRETGINDWELFAMKALRLLRDLVPDKIFVVSTPTEGYWSFLRDDPMWKQSSIITNRNSGNQIMLLATFPEESIGVEQ